MRCCFFTLVLVVVLAVQSTAQNQHANQARGFQANGVYSTKEIDTINLFNGNLNLNIPIGNTYRVSDTLSYSLNLVYNSHLWTSKEICPTGVNVSYSVWVVTINGQTYIEPGPGGPPGDSDPLPRTRDNGGCYTVTAPNPAANAGMGWQLSLGKLYAPDPNPDAYTPNTSESGWVYVSPDGSEHRFYSTSGSVSYTRDGTYIRMKVGGTDRFLGFPDGSVHLFRNLGNTANPDWRVVQMRDQFGNWLNIDYTPTRWTLQDSIGRIHYVNLSIQTGTYQPVVSSVDLTASSGQRAVYNFNYAIRTIPRGCPHVPDANPDYPTYIQVPLLLSVQVPGDFTSYSMSVADYDLDGAQSSCQVIGVLRGLTMPTGARMEWDYGTYRYAFYSSPRAYLRYTTGVLRRRIIENPVLGTGIHQWTYEPVLEPLPMPGFPPQDDPQNNSPKQFYNKVTTPLGHYSIHYFSAYPYPFDNVARDPDAWHGVDYGLPFTKHQFVTDTLGQKLFLSTEVYQVLNTGGYQKVRSTYARYETDQATADDGYGSMRDANRRVIATRTVYHDDDEFGEKFAEVQYADFDGLGHYRSMTTAGNFASGDVRKETARYNPARGTYKIDPTTNNPAPGHTFTQFPEDQEWVINTFDEQTAQQGNSKSVVEFYFDQLGLLKRKRVLKNGQATTVPARSAQDVLVEYRHDKGNVISERHYGGDKQAGLNTSATLSNLILPPQPEYQIDHTYQYGVLKTSRYKINDSTDAVPYKSVDQDVGFNTGFIIATRDTAGVQTTYKYDVLGRLINLQRAKGSWTEYVYTPATVTSGAKVNVYHRPNGGGTAVLSEEEYVYDTLGRLKWEKRKMPDGSMMSRETLYNSMGWKVSVSEFGNHNKKTQYLSYDAFGRPGLIRPPDGSAHDVALGYKGVREIRRTVKLGTSYSAGVVNEEAVTSTEFYDRQGRLDGVKERSGAGGAEVTTKYLYDVGHRLRQAQTISEATQTRTFTYDNRGFLISETHPELGSGAGGSIQYGSYDSRGHTGTKFDGTNTLRYTYEKAERPTLIEEKTVSGTYRPLKEFFYYPTNDAGTLDWRLGKLEKAVRHNYLISPYSPPNEIDVIVSELYQYRGIDGLVSERVTTTNSGAYLFRQSFVHDALGNLQSQTYPKCEHQTCAQSPAATTSRTVNYSYSQGMLTAVNNYATIGYHPNGTVNTVAHTNTVTDTHAMDTNFMLRPASITTSGANLNWSSGQYKYDGAGNVKGIGTERYVYDRVGRVVEGTALAGIRKKQKFTYDAFGNLKTIASYSAADDPAEVPAQTVTNVNSATNRLAQSYDAAGNQLTLSGFNYAYDSLNMLKSAAGRRYIYTPSEELLWTYDGTMSPAVETFTLRGLDGKVLREYAVNGGNAIGNWSWKKDYIYRGTQLVASESSGGRLHYTLDHLGSPRLITNNSAQRVALHQYFPFGEEATSPFQDSEKAKFTGHERETYFNGARDLDYMHARFYTPSYAKFLSVDPGRDFDPKSPQSWNMYSYVRNNPLGSVDLDGRYMFSMSISSFAQRLLEQSWQFEGPPEPPLLPLARDVVVRYGPNARPYFAPEIAKRLNGVIRQLNAWGIVPTINQAFRTADDQNQLKAKGAGGNPVATVSRHQAGYAVDINGTRTPEFTYIRRSMELHNLTWGGTFSKKDPPHFDRNPFGTVGTQKYITNLREAANSAEVFYWEYLAPQH